MTSRRLHQNAWKTWVFSALGLCLGALPVHAATITWKAAVNGSWSLATNWMPAQVPGSGDIAVITTSGNYDVNINGNANVGAINLGSAARLRVNGVTLTTTTGIAVGSAATLELNSGTLSGGGVSLNGQLSSTGTSTVNVGLTTATSSTITVGAGTLTVADGFTNRGLLSYPASGTRNFYVTSGTLINASTGTISSATTSSLSAELINQGSITVTAQRLDIVKSGVAHANTGSISVSGSASVLAFDLSGSTLNTSGSISVNSGCYLSVADGAFQHTGGTISGAGTLQIVATTSATFASNPTVAAMYLAGRGMNFPSALANGAAQSISFGSKADLTVPQFTNQFGHTLDLYGIDSTAVHTPMFTNLGELICPWYFELDGNLNLGPASRLIISVIIGDVQSRLDVNGAVQLNGTLRVPAVILGNFVPGDIFDLITYVDRSGEFAQFEGVIFPTNDVDIFLITDPATTSSNTHPYRVRIVRQKWTPITPTGTAPVPRQGQSTVYAPSSGSMILFGGQNGAGQMLNDVWVLSHADGLSGSPAWIQLNPTGVPPAPRKDHSAVYDLVNNRMTVFGGETDSSDYLSDIWVLTDADGSAGTSAWVPFASIPPVSPRSGHAVGYNPVSNRMVMSHGGGEYCWPSDGDMWVLDQANGVGTTTGWTLWSIPGIPPSIRRDASSAYDPVHNRLLVYGGRTPCGAVQNDAFMLSNADGTPNVATRWDPLGNGATPVLPGQAGAAAAYDPYYDRLVTFGGLEADGTTLSSAVLLINNTLGSAGWTKLPLPITRPDARAFHSMVYSLSAKRWILFGGDANGTLMNDTWVLELEGDGLQVTGIGSDPTVHQQRLLAFSSSPSPNPSSHGMQFSVRALGDVNGQVAIYDVSGRYVAKLHEGPMTAGEHHYTWKGDVASGIYFVTVRTGETQDVRRIVVTR